MKNLLILIFFLIQSTMSEKTIDITGISDQICRDSSDGPMNKQFYFSLQSTLTEFSSDETFRFKIKNKSGGTALCYASATYNTVSCSMNVGLHPIIEEEISLDNTFTKVNDIAIKYSLSNLVIYNGSCSTSYVYKYTINSHENPKCIQYGFNEVDLSGNYEVINSNLASFLDETSTINFNVDTNEEIKTMNCNLDTSDGKMICYVEGPGEIIVHTTIAQKTEDESNFGLIKVEQPFTINLINCNGSNFIKFGLLSLLFLMLF